MSTVKKTGNLLSKELAIVLACVAVFMGLVLASINRSSIWHDEGYTASLIQGSYGGIIERTALDVHPPLYYLLLKSWAFVFGDSITTLRLFSSVCMLGAILITWRIIRRLYGVRAGLVALAAMSMGPFLVRYGQEMRMYGFAALLASVATYLYLKMLDAKRVSYKLGALYGLVIAAGMYTQYFFVLVPMAQALHALWTQSGSILDRIKALKKYVFGTAIGLAIFTPWVPTVLSQFRDVYGAFWIGPVSVETLSSTPLAMTVFKKQYQMTGVQGLIAVVTLAVVILLVRQFLATHHDKKSRLLVASVIAPPVLLFLLSVPPFQPSYQDRYMSFFAPIFYSVLALGVLALSKKYLRIIAATALVLILGYGQVNTYIYGNNHGWTEPVPYFSMNQIADFIDTNAPVYSTSLWTFFDASKTIQSGEVKLLVKDMPTNWKGNWSALYKRPELITTTIPAGIKSFWLIDESSKSQYDGNALKFFKAGRSYTKGYARVTEYTY